MLLAGDEFRRSQGGNNNAYCQDNEVSWIDWSLVEHCAEIHRFLKGMLAFRRAHGVLSREAFYRDRDIAWFDATGQVPDWGDASAKVLACRIDGQPGSDLYLMFNASVEPVSFALPKASPSEAWWLAVDTAQPPPRDVRKPGRETAVPSSTSYPLAARSAAVLIARR